MHKLAILFASLIGTFGLSIPQNIDISASNENNMNQINYQTDDEVMLFLAIQPNTTVALY